MKHQKIDWSRPQRQPAAGLVIAFSQVLWEMVKRAWWLLLFILFKEKPEESSGLNRIEIIAIVLAALTFGGTVLRYLYFRFYIADGELIIKEGWLKKQTIIVPLQKIQTVHIEASLLHQFLHVVKLSVDTAGSDKTEIRIDALHRPMAEALRKQLETEGKENNTEVQKETSIPLVRLSGTDLLKLSFSANHLEALGLLISFGIGLYDNLQKMDDKLFPNVSGIGFTLMAMLFLAAAILIITVIISTVRIFLKFYGLVAVETSAGIAIRSGLTNVKEQMVAVQKIQAVTWKANWIRKRVGLWLVEFRITGNDELKKSQKVQVPVTRAAALLPLINPYAAVPSTSDAEGLRIHPAYVWRRILMAGILPAIFLMLISFNWWHVKALFFLLLPVVVAINAMLYQKHFRLWVFNQVMFLDKSMWGTEKVLLQWHKIQSVRLKQSFFQRKHHLATIVLYTAGGSFIIPFVPLEDARTLVNYALYRVESNTKKWM